MKKIIINFFAAFLYMMSFWHVASAGRAAADAAIPEVTITGEDRVLILAPHPDDEVLGCAGVIQKACYLKIPLRIVFLTYGDSNEGAFLKYRKHPVIMPKAVEKMGLLRRDEAIEADKYLGVPPENLVFLGYPDFHALSIWNSHWGDTAPVRSILTHAKEVPYSNAFRPGAAYKGEEILWDLETIMREFKPTKIFVSHPADHNPDHRALYLFTRVCLWDLEGEMRPAVYPYLTHYKQWPRPAGFHPELALGPPKGFELPVSWQSVILDKDEISRKLNAIKKHVSQYNDDRELFLSFIRSNELFGDIPVSVLNQNSSSIILSPDSKEILDKLPERLIDEEHVSFLGIEERSAHIENSNFVLSIKLSRPFGKTVGMSVYVFGYRKDLPFEKMPKLHIEFGEITHEVYDQNRRLPGGIVKIYRGGKEIKVSLPLEAVGKPEYILTSAHMYLLGTIPLDWVFWQVLQVPSLD